MRKTSWEAYKFSLDGEIETTDVSPNSNGEGGADHDNTLYVSNAGPAVALDGQSIAVAFGNTVKVIRSARRGSMSRRPTGRTAEKMGSSSMDGMTPPNSV